LLPLRRLKAGLQTRHTENCWFLLAGLLALAAAGARADEEQDLIATLRSDTTISNKCTACERLRLIGTVKSVPALAALLQQPGTAQAARYALEKMPSLEAGTALREALRTSSGLIQSGLADSVGWRQDLVAVPLLKPLLRGTNAVVASAAATALGRIGNKEATADLVSVRNKVPPEVQPAVLNAILQAADQRLAAGDAQAATALYRKLYTPRYQDRFRVAAWRGIVVADSRASARLVSRALAGQDRSLQLAALKVVRELDDPAVVKACLRYWPSLSAPCQLAVLDAQVKVGGDVLSTVRLAIQSSYPSVRASGWLALCDLGDVSTIPALAKAAAHAKAPERDAAREALTRVRGPGVRESILSQIASSEPEEKAELLRALGDRGDTDAATVLLDNATGTKPARLAALESLRKLAVPSTLVPLLRIAAKSASDQEREPAMEALYAVCDTSKDKEQTTRSILDAMKPLPASERRQVMPVLAQLGTPAALETAEAAAREQDPELAKEAVRVLGQWPNSAPAVMLLELARTGTGTSLRVLALRGCIEVASLEPDKARRLQMLEQAHSAATRPEEKKQVLGKVGQIPSPAALQLAVADLDTPELANEAASAAITIAEQLPAANGQLANETAAKLLDRCKEPEVMKRAVAIRVKHGGPVPFIQDWLVCGPFSQPGLDDLTAIFNFAFDPEKPGANVQWKPAPRADGINLGKLFPGKDNCAAYLKTQLTVPEDCDAFLLLGSDDGVKAWLNQVVVHANDISRGDVPDQDVAPVHLKKGSNELMLKITQGSAGWSAHARIVGHDGRAIASLHAEAPATIVPTAAASAGKSQL
jgi:HEAT repeat protein